MGQQTIAIMYSPIPNVPGAFHESLVYTDSTGNQQVLSAAPSDPSNGSASQKGYSLITEEVALEEGQPTGRGYIAAQPATTFTVDQQNTDNQAYVATFLRNGLPLQTTTVGSGSDLSSQWAAIQSAYASINSAQIPYSSISQNSNSAASTALVAAGIQPPSYAPALILDTPYPGIDTTPQSNPPWTPGNSNILPIPGVTPSNSQHTEIQPDGNGGGTIAVTQNGQDGVQVVGNIYVGDGSSGTLSNVQVASASYIFGDSIQSQNQDGLVQGSVNVVYGYGNAPTSKSPFGIDCSTSQSA